MKNATAYLLTKLYFLYSLVVDCRLILGTFMTKAVSVDERSRPLQLNWLWVLNLKVIYFLRYIFRNQELFNKQVDTIFEAIVSDMKKQPYHASQTLLEIPKFELDEISAEEFYNNFVKYGRPAVFKNVTSEARDKWCSEYFIKHYANKKLVVGDEEGNDETKTVENYLNDSKIDYAQNTVDILNECPELIEQLGIHRFEPYMVKVSNAVDKGYFGSEIFMGKSSKTGTSFHCAGGENLFFMLSGRKRWTLISPEYTWLMQPIFNKDMAYVASDISRETLHKPEVLDKLHPVFKYAPRYVVDLEPGDVLFNPSWYWHQIDNLTDETIAVATRWVTDIKQTNRLFTLMECFSSYSHRLLQELIKTDFDYVYTDDLMRNESLSGLENVLGFGSEKKAEIYLDNRRKYAERMLTEEEMQFFDNIKVAF
ncbi:MAG: cupin-like domain-containing protein [Exilibacterium sp.]